MTVLMAESERKLQDILDSVLEESNKQLTNHQLQENRIIMTKWKSIRWKLQIADNGIKQLQNFKYLENGLTDDRTCDTVIRKRIGQAKEAFQKMNKLLKKQNEIVRNKEKSAGLLCVIHSHIW